MEFPIGKENFPVGILIPIEFEKKNYMILKCNRKLSSYKKTTCLYQIPTGNLIPIIIGFLENTIEFFIFPAGNSNGNYCFPTEYYFVKVTIFRFLPIR